MKKTVTYKEIINVLLKPGKVKVISLITPTKGAWISVEKSALIAEYKKFDAKADSGMILKDSEEANTIYIWPVKFSEN
jgi:hypothetical protein